MIDTMKIYTSISEDLYNKIELITDISTKFNVENQQVYYKLVNGSVKGSFDSDLHYNIFQARYGFDYVLVLEGSYHKLMQGVNSHNGFYNIAEVVSGMIRIFEIMTGFSLPRFYKWFIARIDISFCYDLLTQYNVKTYINNNRFLQFPKRKTLFNLNESLYFAGSRTTLKIYNKFREFMAHDYNKIKKFTDFNLCLYKKEIQGFVRFECEIRKKKILELCFNNNVVFCDICVFENFVKGEFMKLFKINDLNLCIVRSQNDVKNLLYDKFNDCKARRLFGFYLNLVNDGLSNVKEEYSKSSYFRNISDLKLCGIDFNQQAFIIDDKPVESKFIDFVPFTESKYIEVI